MTTYYKCPKCKDWIETVYHTVIIYTPDGEYEKSFLVDIDEEFPEAEITDEVIGWCSNHGFSYDDCQWEYKDIAKTWALQTTEQQ